LHDFDYTDRGINDVKTDSRGEAVLTGEDANFKYLRTSLDHICSEIAVHFDFCSHNGEPRTAAIIDILASSPRIGHIIGKFQRQHRPNIDAVYLENHRLAVGILVERLHGFLANRGYNVLALTDVRSKDGTTDVLIAPTHYGVNLQHNGKKIIIEVKTGKSLSYSQLFRYLLDVSNATLVLWRIKKRQVAVLRRKSLQPMLQAFMQMCILRGERVLAAETVKCQTVPPKSFTLSSTELENTVNEFAERLIETLPVVLETVLREIRSNDENARVMVSE